MLVRGSVNPKRDVSLPIPIHLVYDPGKALQNVPCSLEGVEPDVSLPILIHLLYDPGRAH